MQLDESELELKRTALARIAEAEFMIENSLKEIQRRNESIASWEDTHRLNSEILFWIEKKEQL